MTGTEKELPAHSQDSGNIFADLGLPNAKEYQLKAALVVQLKRLITERYAKPPSWLRRNNLTCPSCSGSNLSWFRWKS